MHVDTQEPITLLKTADTSAIRLLLVDDHEVVRVGLKMLLERNPRLRVIGEATNMADAITEVVRLKPDVVLLDIRLPDGNGFEVCRRLRTMNVESRIVFLTSFSDDETVFEGISAGADGYLLKEADSDQLIKAIETVASGQSVLDPTVTTRVLGRVRNASDSPNKDRLAILSNQERKVLALVAEGKTNKEIALDMGLSDKTVKNYFSNILDKLKLTRRSQAAAFFVQHLHK
jgi:two-component system response regulator DevR